MIKIGLLGVGHFGKFHLAALKEISEFEFMGFYDIDQKKSAEVAAQYGVKSFDSYEAMLNVVDAVDIVVPTISHYECAVQAIRRSKHVFIEKPVTNTLEEAENIIKLSEEANVKVQVGHVERFNPAFMAVRQMIGTPMFIEIHRLAQFNPRSTDVSVVLNLMIHDIDIVLSTVRSNIKKISASGVSIVTNTPDIANVRIEFDNGCVANITASRISLKNMRKCRFFQKEAYISIDFLKRETEVIRIKSITGEADPLAMVLDTGEETGKKEISIEKPDIIPNNAIQDELASFAHSIKSNTTPAVSIDDGYQALMVAHKILDIIKLTTSVL
jgi:predicted dehydrogenase